MTLLEENVASLPTDVARRVLAAEPRGDEVAQRSRDGHEVPGIRGPAREILFHSRYAPLREAARLADTPDGVGFTVVFGLGAGYHLLELANRGLRVLVIEPDAALIRFALERVDLTDVLGSASIVLVCDEPSVPDALAAAYLPALHGDLAVVDLPGRVASEPERFARLRNTVNGALESIRDDTAVQARFGLLWMRNALFNAMRSTPAPLPSWHGKRVFVAAAGPSLVDHLARLAARGNRPLLAVDTALPVLLAHGVRPDVTLSIDCQLPTYHHFLRAGVAVGPVAAELSLPPSLFGRLSQRIPVASDHPLHRLFRSLGLALPYVDARAGNVTEAAVDLAVRSGAAEITLVGADDAYPCGETYPRGSYVHALFESRATRLAPLDTLHYGFLLDRPGVTRDPDDPTRWVQPLLTRYARSMAGTAARLPVRFDRMAGRGIPLPKPGSAGQSAPPATRPDHPDGARSAFTSAAPRDVVGAVRDLIGSLAARRSYEAAVRAGDTEGLAARALLPLMTHLRARSQYESLEELVSKAVAIGVELADQALALEAGE